MSSHKCTLLMLFVSFCGPFDCRVKVRKLTELWTNSQASLQLQLFFYMFLHVFFLHCIVLCFLVESLYLWRSCMLCKMFRLVFYCEVNPSIFHSKDDCFLVCYSTIMLNTLLHNPSVKDKPTFERYLFLLPSFGRRLKLKLLYCSLSIGFLKYSVLYSFQFRGNESWNDGQTTRTTTNAPECLRKYQAATLQVSILLFSFLFGRWTGSEYISSRTTSDIVL